MWPTGVKRRGDIITEVSGEGETWSLTLTLSHINRWTILNHFAESADWFLHAEGYWWSPPSDFNREKCQDEHNSMLIPVCCKHQRKSFILNYPLPVLKLLVLFLFFLWPRCCCRLRLTWSMARFLQGSRCAEEAMGIRQISVLQIWERMWNHFLCFCPNP